MHTTTGTSLATGSSYAHRRLTDNGLDKQAQIEFVRSSEGEGAYSALA